MGVEFFCRRNPISALINWNYVPHTHCLAALGRRCDAHALWNILRELDLDACSKSAICQAVGDDICYVTHFTVGSSSEWKVCRAFMCDARRANTCATRVLCPFTIFCHTQRSIKACGHAELRMSSSKKLTWYSKHIIIYNSFGSSSNM